MKILFEIIGEVVSAFMELIFEGSATSKIPKPLRMICIALTMTFFGGGTIFLGIYMVALAIKKEYEIAMVIAVIFVFFAVGTYKMVKRIIRAWKS